MIRYRACREAMTTPKGRAAAKKAWKTRRTISAWARAHAAEAAAKIAFKDYYVQRLTFPDQTAADVLEIQRQYRVEAEEDLRELKRELRIAARKAVLSKEVAYQCSPSQARRLPPSLGFWEWVRCSTRIWIIAPPGGKPSANTPCPGSISVRSDDTYRPFN
jgi:hypothetical protein